MPANGITTYKFLINGDLVDGESNFSIPNPSTLDEAGKCPHATQVQVDAAVNAASEAQPAWALLELDERKKLLLKAADTLEANIDKLGALLVEEQGKPLAKAGRTGEVSWAIGYIRNAVKEITLEPETLSATTKVYRRPIGVIVGVTPWNFPVYCAIQKWAPALLLGNTFVHKPSPFTPLTGLLIGQFLKDVFPKGVFNVVTGDDKTDFNVGAYLSKHSKVNMVSFTGSVPTGKKIMEACSGSMRRVNLEAGGNDAAIVLPDAKPAELAQGLFNGAFANTGQICCAVKRCYVHESIHDEVVDELVKCAKKAKIGDGFGEGVEYGPMNNKMQFDKVMDFINDTKKLPEAVIHCGGGKMQGDGLKGYFIEPTIVSGLKEGTRLVDEEQFGPVLPIIKYSDVSDAVKRANDSKYGLGASVWSPDEAKAASVGAQLQAGTVWVNCHTNGTGGPFGGFKESGIGREGSKLCDVSTFTEMQTVYVLPKK